MIAGLAAGCVVLLAITIGTLWALAMRRALDAGRALRIEAGRALRIEAGQTYVIESDHVFSEEQLRRLDARLKRELPDVKFILLDQGMRIVREPAGAAS